MINPLSIFQSQKRDLGHRKTPISGVHTPCSSVPCTYTLIVVYLEKLRKEMELEDGEGGLGQKSAEQERLLSLPSNQLTPY